MPDSETFDAFYARTVWNVTNQMHALAGDDGAADHAIREAYARAYQQWYEIAGYPDTEGWVLAIAKEAYQRRRPEAAMPVRDRQVERAGHDPLSMPGMFRPAMTPAESSGTGDTTLAPPAAARADGGQANGWFTPASEPPGPADGANAGNPAQGISGVFGGPAGGSGHGMATAQLAGNQPALSGQPAEPTTPWRPGRQTRVTVGGRRRRSVVLIALVAVVVLAAAGVAYLISGQHPSGRTASHGATHGKPAVRMLGAGKTGTRSAIPWSLVGSGWTLAEVSSAQAGTGLNGTGGNVTTYVVDPEGGRYQVQTSTGSAPVLLAWSGNAQTALFAQQTSSPGTSLTYDLLSLTTGDLSPLPLPPGVTAVGFTRPDGLNILAVSQTATAFQLDRFNLQGAFQATIGSLPVKPGVTPDWQDCGTECGALSSPDGLYAVWGVHGDQMQFLSNAGGPVIRRLDVPDSGSPPSCAPLTWWNSGTVLASCGVTGQPAGVSRLWLVPDDGTTPTALTSASGSPSGSGFIIGAWQGPNGVFVNQTNARQCPGSPSGPGGLALATISGGSLQPVSVGGTTNNHTSVVSVSGGRLLLLAQSGCPSSSSLLWLDPSTGATQTVLSAPASQVGVVAAVPYGNGPTAISGG